MKHEVDKAGFPTDPQLRRLEDHLGYLADIWRGTQNQNIIREYHVTVGLLYELGWDGILDYESLLPISLMPEEYLRKQKINQ